MVGFSIVGIYTLVKWQQGDGIEWFTGETLWRENVPVILTGGQIDFSFELDSKPQATSVWELVSNNEFSGIPKNLLTDLRENLVFL